MRVPAAAAQLCHVFRSCFPSLLHLIQVQYLPSGDSGSAGMPAQSGLYHTQACNTLNWLYSLDMSLKATVPAFCAHTISGWNPSRCHWLMI